MSAPKRCQVIKDYDGELTLKQVLISQPQHFILLHLVAHDSVRLQSLTNLISVSSQIMATDRLRVYSPQGDVVFVPPNQRGEMIKGVHAGKVIDRILSSLPSVQTGRKHLHCSNRTYDLSILYHLPLPCNHFLSSPARSIHYLTSLVSALTRWEHSHEVFLRTQRSDTKRAQPHELRRFTIT